MIAPLYLIFTLITKAGDVSETALAVPTRAVCLGVGDALRREAIMNSGRRYTVAYTHLTCVTGSGAPIYGEQEIIPKEAP